MSTQAGSIKFTSVENTDKEIVLDYNNDPVHAHKSICNSSEVRAVAFIVGQETACNTVTTAALAASKSTTNADNVGVGSNSIKLTDSPETLKIKEIIINKGYALLLLSSIKNKDGIVTGSRVKMVISNESNEAGGMYSKQSKNKFNAINTKLEFIGPYSYQLNYQIDPDASITYSYVDLAVEGDNKLELPFTQDITHARVIRLCDIKRVSSNATLCPQESVEGFSKKSSSKLMMVIIIMALLGVFAYLYYSGYFIEKEIITLDIESIDQ